MNAIVLDSGPLGLIVHKAGVKAADDCRTWLAGHIVRGVRVVVPEIIDFELRRELLRLVKHSALADLEAFEVQTSDRFLPLTTLVLRHAAVLWADARRQGYPTAAPHELDVDVILAAQALSLELPPSQFIVATSNPVHLSRFVPADTWQNI
ncbi:MAG TPA: hypothetical protein VH475_27960 [Tepidisphaeraceae bacterium]|jgi:predicted nucleic acid-binding protein